MIISHLKVTSLMSQFGLNITRGLRRRPNPGIENQLGMIKGRENLISESEIDFDDMESDFASVHHSHKQFEKEVNKYKEKEKLWIVKQKYFKEKNYNFLTWAEKEQIKYLHEQDPEEWTTERLAESFPASQFIIAKVLKSKWSSTDQKRIFNHDKSVDNNWKLLNSGEIDIDFDLKKHLMKFSDRNHLISKESNNIATIHLKHKYKNNFSHDEFSRIITDYKCVNQKSENLDAKAALPEGNKVIHKPKKDMYIIDGQNTNRSPLTTLSQLKQKMLHTENELNLKKSDLDKTEDDSAPNNLNVIEINAGLFNKYNRTNKAVMKYNSSLPEKDIYPESIKIPSKIWKKDTIYKLDDCFYDDDGEFLYRVPGLTGK